MRPPSTGTSPAIRRSSVVLPEPDGPSSATSCPEGIARSMGLSAAKPSKFLPTPSMRMSMGSVSVLACDPREGIAVAAFQPQLDAQRQERQEGEQGRDGEGRRRVEFVVQDL